MLPHIALALSVAGVTALISGCGHRAPEFGQVTGVVRIMGQPHRRLIVRFLPDPQKGNDVAANATGVTDEHGEYELKYVYEGNEGLGAPVGWHRVLIEDAALSQVPQGQAPPPQLIPASYNSPATTPLSKEVKAGSQKIDLEVGN